MVDTETPRVCVVAPYSYAYFDAGVDVAAGGAERQLYLLSQELAGEFDVHFVVGDFGQPRTVRRDGVTLHRAYEPGGQPSLSRQGSRLVSLFDAMRRADADVYVFRGGHPRAVATYTLARLLGAAFVYNLAVDSHADPGDGRLSGAKRAVLRRVLRDADGVIAQSERQRRRLAESLGVDAAVVPNGYPPAEDPSPGRGEFLLYVGSLNPGQKRPHLFLELAARLPGERFVLVGGGDDDAYTRRIERAAAELDNVEFVGRVDPGAVHDYYRRAVALVNTSAREGFPNTFLEAWRTGTPVVSLDVDPGRFGDWDAGGYAGGDFDELVSLTRRVAVDASLRERLGARALRNFEENFRISATADAYADALRSALDACREKPREQRVER